MRARCVLYSAALFALVGLRQNAAAQSNDLFTKLKVDVSIVVYKHSTGADMVTITVRAPDYPAAELEARATEIGTELGTPVRGLKVSYKGNGSQASRASPFLIAEFATNGILGGEADIRLQPLVRSFAGGAGSSVVEGMDIHLEGAKSSPGTLYNYTSSSVDVEGRPESSPPALDYRVRLKSQKPGDISIPDRAETVGSAPAPTPPASGTSSVVIWILVIVGALAVFALVYNLALRVPRRTHRG